MLIQNRSIDLGEMTLYDKLSIRKYSLPSSEVVLVHEQLTSAVVHTFHFQGGSLLQT